MLYNFIYPIVTSLISKLLREYHFSNLLLNIREFIDMVNTPTGFISSSDFLQSSKVILSSELLTFS